MTEATIEEFIANFDDSRFPVDFLQKYELMECFSHNETGETLLIKDRDTGEYFVAKCYSEKTLLPHATESDLLKKLDHESVPKGVPKGVQMSIPQGVPNFVGEYENEKMLCVVRTFAKGQSLDKIVRENPLSKHQSIDIAVQLCDILAYLHGQIPPIIHRDIKPQNVIMSEQGKITLIDFGISRTYNQMSQEDTLNFGTRHFAAPEQYGFAQTDCRSDIFSLGILLCWLLTGKTDTQQAKKLIPDHQLYHVISKCAAFDPRDRYKSANQVKKALTQNTLHRHLLTFLLSVLIILGAFLFVPKLIGAYFIQPNGITFKEPLIEEAVRLTLGKDETSEITEQDLLSISELYIYGNKAAANSKTYDIYAESFANNEGTVLRGNIETLDDLVKLNNLRSVSLAYQNISDLTALSDLEYLETLDLRHNPIDDISPLSQIPRLSTLILFNTNISDLTSLSSCPYLSLIDIGFTQVKTIAALDGLGSLQTIVIRKAPLRSLEHIETHPLLEKIYLSETQIMDLSPLLDLPRLKLVEVSENMRSAAESVIEQAQFSIIYQ